MAAAAGNGASNLPEPVVKIDNEADPFATVVTIEYGDRLGELLDTVGAAGLWVLVGSLKNVEHGAARAS